MLLSLSNPAGGSPKASLCSPMGRWLWEGTTEPPAGRSMLATVRVMAIRHTEWQTGSGEREQRQLSVTLNFDVIHSSMWHTAQWASKQHKTVEKLVVASRFNGATTIWISLLSHCGVKTAACFCSETLHMADSERNPKWCFSSWTGTRLRGFFMLQSRPVPWGRDETRWFEVWKVIFLDLPHLSASTH